MMAISDIDRSRGRLSVGQEQFAAFDRVPPHDGEFVLGQLARLVEDFIGYLELSNIVEHATNTHLLKLKLKRHQAQLTPQCDRENPHAQAVFCGVFIAVLDSREPKHGRRIFQDVFDTLLDHRLDGRNIEFMTQFDGIKDAQR